MLACAGRLNEAKKITMEAVSVKNLQILTDDRYFPLNTDPNLSTSVAHYFYQVK